MPYCRGRVALENEVHFLDRDLVGQRRQLVEHLPCDQARLAAERLREEEQAHGPGQLRKVLAETCLIAGRDQSHRCRPTAGSGPVRLLEQVIEGLPGGRRAGVLVWRSTVVRGAKNVHRFRSSFGATRAVRACCVHSQRALVSNDMQLTQLCTSMPQRRSGCLARPAGPGGCRSARSGTLRARHQVRRLRSGLALERSSRGLRLWRGLLAPRRWGAGLVLVTALAVLAIRHAGHPALRGVDRQAGRRTR